MLHIALYQPEIPPNTGNIIRLCANLGGQLHLIHPLGFEVNDAKLRRAGLDYHDWTRVIMHADFAQFCQTIAPRRLFACSTKGTTNYNDAAFADEDVLLFGPETRGLPSDVLAYVPTEHILRIPMMPNNRSLNLSNAAAIIAYEAWRQLDFCGAS
jgi:tRNA (cytidine/uridine-2'-O-)-methyltransferase